MTPIKTIFEAPMGSPGHWTPSGSIFQARAPGGTGPHPVPFLGQNFKLTFTPLNLVQSSPFDLQNDQQDRAHLLKATCVFDENDGFSPDFGPRTSQNWRAAQALAHLLQAVSPTAAPAIENWLIGPLSPKSQFWDAWGPVPLFFTVAV